MTTMLSDGELAPIHALLRPANEAFARRYPGESGRRQPVHTVYGGGHLFKSTTAKKLGALAKKSLAEHAPDAATFARALGLSDEALARTVFERVTRKLDAEPVEDFRVDFEDGYGVRTGAEEDAHAEAAGHEMAKGAREGTLPPFIGVRVKPLTRELAARSLRTLDLFLGALVRASGGALPPGFVVTLPKVQRIEHVKAFVAALSSLEAKLGLAEGTIPIELMVEQTQTLVLEDGRSALPLLHDAAGGRLSGAHFGTYDYTASVGVAAAHQHMDHPACDFARQMMQVAFAGTGVFLSDGATNVLPVGDTAAVHRAWNVHYANVSRSLALGFYQGWDLHPAQLPSRFAAVTAFYASGLAAATARLKNFIEQAARATLVGDVFDDAATGQGLLNFFLRGVASGALTEDEALATGLSLDEYRSRSFVSILEARSKR